MNSIKLVYIFIAIVFVACGPSQREKAVWKINEGKQILASGDTLKAIATFDSIKILFPKASAQIGVCENITDDLYRLLIETRRKELIIADTLIAYFEQNFIQEKTTYDKYSQYIHKNQTFHRSWNRSFLGIHLDERGVLFISSNYTGKEKLNHTAIKVYDGRLEATSDKVELSDPLNHQSDFNEMYWERVSYMNGKADSVIRFIANNPQLKLKCVFLGTRQYYILLEPTDVLAVTDALALSTAIISRKSLTESIRNLEGERRSK